MADRSHILIIALRRSGTTALWRVFRELGTHVGFDEPFRPNLDQLPAENRKGTNKELIALYRSNPNRFNELFAPIPLAQNLSCGLTDAQRRYLAFLAEAGPLVLDETRFTRKLADVQQEMPDAVCVHLYRSPIAFTSSCLVPSEMRDLLGVRKSWSSATLFSRKSGYRVWGMEELTRTEYVDVYKDFLAAEGIEVPARDATAAERLLALWLAAFRYTEREASRLYGDRFISLSFEAFCRDPGPAVSAMARMAGFDVKQVDISALRSASPGTRIHDGRWSNLLDRVGFSDVERQRLSLRFD